MTRTDPPPALLAVALALLASPSMAEPPVPVSPGSPSGGEIRTVCPSFSWTVGELGGPYELVVYPVTAAGDLGPEPALSARLPEGARSWTPSSDRCLDPGSLYAWTLRETGSGSEGDWSEPALFQVGAGPSEGEVETAIATLRRYLAERRVEGTAPDPSAAAPEPPRSTPSASLRERLAASSEGGAGDSEAGAAAARASGPLGSAADPGAGAPRAPLAPAAAPVLGSPSLSLSSDIALAAASDVFKDGSVFLWDDTSGNTALGREALASATGTATGNTAVGYHALTSTTAGAGMNDGSRNTATGELALSSNTTGSSNTGVGFRALFHNDAGYSNTASGDMALFSNTDASFQTAHGFQALYSNTVGNGNVAVGAVALRSTTGSYNTAVGTKALFKNTQGKRNVAIGNSAGYFAYGAGSDDNIFIANLGTAGDANKIRIGTQGTQDGTFIAGIHGVTTGEEAIPVLIDNTGQLGTMLSSRAVKRDVRDIGELSERLLALRPVAFRYEVNAAANPQTPLQFGLIAEEVAEVFPDLVAFDEQGRPVTVKYHLLAALLLNELQRQSAAYEGQRAELERLRRESAVRDERLDALERTGDATRAGRQPSPPSRPGAKARVAAGGPP